MESELVKYLVVNAPNSKLLQFSLYCLIVLQVATIFLKFFSGLHKNPVLLIARNPLRRNTRKLVNDHLKYLSINTESGGLKIHLMQLKETQIFHDIAKIECKKNLREKLIWLYNHTPSNFSWNFIRSAVKHIKLKNDEDLFVYISPIEKVFYFLFYLQALFCSVLAFCFIYIFLTPGSFSFLVSLLAIIFFAVYAFYFLDLTTPYVRANMISKELNRLYRISDFNESRSFLISRIATYFVNLIIKIFNLVVAALPDKLKIKFKIKKKSIS